MMDEAVGSLDTGDQGVAKELLRALTHLPGSPTSRPAAESELVHTHGDGARRQVVLRQLETRWRPMAVTAVKGILSLCNTLSLASTQPRS